MFNKLNKGNSMIGLPFLFTIILFILTLSISCNDHSYDDNYQKPHRKIEIAVPDVIDDINYTKIYSHGIIFDIDLLNNIALINHNKIKGYKDTFDNLSTPFYFKDSFGYNIGDSVYFEIKHDIDYKTLDTINIIENFGVSSIPIYDVTGVIHEIRSSENKLLINHEEIKGFMSKMTMLLNVHESVNINNFENGDSVNFKLFITDQNHFTINYNKVGKSNTIINNEIDDELFEDNLYSQREVGEYLDNATFLDLNGNEVSLDDIEGQIKMISFIFSRCPIPNMCPAVIRNNQYLASQFDNIKLIIISFDYLYDTPKIMSKNYKFIEETNSNIIFLSSYKHLDDLYQFTEQVGYEFWGVEKDEIGHQNRHVIVNNDSKILNYFDGFEIKAGDLKRFLENYLK